MQTKFSLSAAIALAAASFSVLATNAEPLTEETIVTATRTSQSIADTLAPVQVLTAADIEKLQLRDMSDLLGRMTSVSVKTSGGRGSNTSVFVRGANSGQLLVMIDGVRVGSATLGQASLQHIDPASIERIELVRGARSSLYGSDAIGGVLQIFTRKGEQHSGAEVRLGAGTNDEQELLVRGTVRGESGWLMAQVGHVENEGFDRTVWEENNNDDEDIYRNTSVALDAGYDFSDSVGLSANYQRNEGKSEYDSRFCFSDCDPYSEFKNQAFSAKLKTQWTKEFGTLWVAGRNIDESLNDDSLNPMTSPDEFKTTRDFFDIQNDWAINSSNLLTFGADYYNDKVDASNTEYSEDSRDNFGVYAQYQLSFGRNSFVFGVREDDNEQFGTETTGNVSYGFDFTDELKLIASWGTAFKAPSFNDLYYQSPWGSNGNPDLLPEDSENYELGLKYNGAAVNAELIAFHNDIDNLIQWAPTFPGSWVWQPANVSEAEIEGVEASLGTEVFGWTVAANYTWMNAEDKASGKDLVYRPDNSFNFSADNTWGDFSLGFSVRAQDSVYHDTANQTTVAGFGLLDARASYQATDSIKLELKVNNLLDKEYQTNKDYNEEGVNGFFGVSFSL